MLIRDEDQGMNDKAYLAVSGTLFGLVSIGHLMRLIMQTPVQIGTWTFPMWPSAIAVVVTFVLCVWAFRAAKTR